jgi:cell division protein FtsW
MLASSSFTFSFKYFGVPHQFLLKQLAACFIGILALILLTNIDYHLLSKVDHLLLLLALGLTGLTLIPPLSHQGRWINLGWVNLQPAELLKPALILFMASSLIRKSRREKPEGFQEIFLPYLVILGVISILLMCQPDFGMTILLAMVVLLMLFVSGSATRYFIYIGLSSIPFVFLFIFYVPYRRERILSFLNPFRYKLAGGYQLIQSLTALGSGGVFGRGLGGSREKLFYLPSAYNDFIFSITGEEFGFIGTTLLMILFALWGYKGIKIALRAADKLGTLLAFGITFTILIQAGLNMGVMVGVLPVTGLTLPFISFGGSSLIVSLAMVGILLNISKSHSGRKLNESVSSWRGNWRTSLPRTSSYGFPP